MDEFLVASDLCEENGLPCAAGQLREVSASGGRVYIVVERGWEYDDSIYEPEDAGKARSIHLDRDSAERIAISWNIQTLREINVLGFCYALEHVTKFSADELSTKMAEILGREYRFLDGRWDDDYSADDPTIPEDADDSQARAIADLFTLKFAYVVETEVAG